MRIRDYRTFAAAAGAAGALLAIVATVIAFGAPAQAASAESAQLSARPGPNGLGGSEFRRARSTCSGAARRGNTSATATRVAGARSRLAVSTSGASFEYLAFRQPVEGRRVGVLTGSPDGHLYFHGLSWQCLVSREKWIQSGKTTKETAEDLIDMLGERR